jgi:hypothetical protein
MHGEQEQSVWNARIGCSIRKLFRGVLAATNPYRQALPEV